MPARIQTFLVALISLLGITPVTAKDRTPAEFVGKHLNAIGSPEARSRAKTRVVEGTATYKVLVGGSVQIVGKAVMASEQHKLQLLLKINALTYHGERFISDGKKTSVAGTYDDHTRSEFGEFLRAENAPLREGLLGGVWSTAWPLADEDLWRGKIQGLGLKKVEGRELEALAYKCRNSDLQVTLYFEPESFHHVLTLYTARIAAQIGAYETQSARQNETRYRIEERFSDFQQNDGLTLPTHYDLRFTEELGNDFTKTVEWEVIARRILNDVPLDPRNFQIQ